MLSQTIVREVPAYTAQFYTYELIKGSLQQRLPPGVTDLPPPQLIFAGGISGLGCWLASYPQDLVKSLLQVRSLNSIHPRN